MAKSPFAMFISSGRKVLDQADQPLRVSMNVGQESGILSEAVNGSYVGAMGLQKFHSVIKC